MDKGGLCYPTTYLVKIIFTVKKIVPQHANVDPTSKLYIKLTYDALKGARNNFLQHAKGIQEESSNHYFTPVRTILERFFQTWQNHANIWSNQALHPSKKRNKLTRLATSKDHELSIYYSNYPFLTFSIHVTMTLSRPIKTNTIQYFPWYW